MPNTLLSKLNIKPMTSTPTESVSKLLAPIRKTGESIVNAGGTSYVPPVQPTIQPTVQPTQTIKPITPTITSNKQSTPGLRELTYRSNATKSIAESAQEKQIKQDATERAKMLERQIQDKYGVKPKRVYSPLDYARLSSQVDPAKKEQFKKDFDEYTLSLERSNPFRAGAEAGFNVLPTMLEITAGKEDVQSAKGYNAGRFVGGAGQQAAFASVLGAPLEGLIGKGLGSKAATGIGKFAIEAGKDTAIGLGTNLAEAPFDKTTAGDIAVNVAADIALNALFGVVGKAIGNVSKVDLVNAKPQVVEQVAKELNVDNVKASQVIDNAIEQANLNELRTKTKTTQPFITDQSIPTVNKTVDNVNNIKPTSMAENVSPTAESVTFDVTKQKTVDTTPISNSIDDATPLENIKFIDTKTRVMTEMPKKIKPNLGDSFERLYQETVSKNVPFERIGGKANIQASNLNRTQGTIEYNLIGKQTDMIGNEIGKSAADIFSDVKETDKKELFDYILNVHNIDRYNQGKPVFGSTVTSNVSDQLVKQYDVKSPVFKEKQQEITKYFNNLLNDWYVKSGLVSEDTAKLLQETYPNYVPTYRYKDLPKGMTTGSNVSQVIKKAKGGDDFILPIDDMIVSMTDRAVKNARKNELMNTLNDIFESNPESISKYVKEVRPVEQDVVSDLIDVGKSFDEMPVAKGDEYLLNFYKDGEKKQMVVNKTLYKALENVQSDNSIQSVANFVKRYGTNPMKATITGYNPLFSASNIMRDIPTALVFSSNPINMSKQVPDAVKEMLTNGEKFKLFKAMGGTREGLIGSGKNFKVPTLKETSKVMNAVKKANPVKTVGDINNFTETLPRFSEFLNVLEKTGDPATAIYKSAELTTDFSRHGNFTKLVDSFVPYLNPSVQGIDKFFRETTKRPIKTALKGVGAITVPTVILDQINKDNKNYQELSPRERNLYYNIPIDNGKKFIRIPKSRELGVAFSSIYEFAARALRGEKVTGEEISQAIQENFTPTDVINSSIVTPALRAWNQIKEPDSYQTNYWGSLIVPESQRNYSPGEQYDLNSSGIAKAIGQQFNISPYVVDYLLKSYTGIIGQTIQPIGMDKKTSLLDPITNKFINDPVYKSDSINQFYEALNDATKAKNDFYRQNDLESADVTDFEKGKSYYTSAEKPILNTALRLKKEASLLTSASKELSDLRKEQKKLQVSNDANRKELLRQLQIKMNELAKKALEGGK